jgi:broad specificity phosphatase PhoE
MLEHIWLMRHGETEWTLSGAHTGRTDLPLTQRGEERARDVGKILKGRKFAMVLSSPLLRAKETCRLAGYSEGMKIDSRLLEWDYGDYEGKTTVDIRKLQPGWFLWRDGVPGGETAAQVGARADAVIDELKKVQGEAAIFSHGHFLRVFAARWLQEDPTGGRLLALDTASISVLGFERDVQVIRHWNMPSDAC